jgi:hypothetical protein
VRYADDWLIGVWGNKDKAKALKEQINVFLKTLLLELSIEKTLITNARAERAKFLGVIIKRATSNKVAAPLSIWFGLVWEGSPNIPNPLIMEPCGWPPPFQR